MKRQVFSCVIPALIALLLFASSGLAHEHAICSSEKAAAILLEGNRRFALKGGAHSLVAESTVEKRKELAGGQHPIAVVIACSDSRVPPEIIFDQGLGELFVIRVAGNIVGPHETGSVEYAVDHLGVRLVVILGHEKCGAVTAAYEAYTSGHRHEGNIGTIMHAITPAVEAALKDASPEMEKGAVIEQCSLRNLSLVAGQLVRDSPILKKALEQGRLEIVEWYYRLSDGSVTVVE